YLITPRISNDLRVNYSNDRIGTKFQLDDFGGAAPLPDSVLFPSGFTSANSAFGFYIPGIGQINQGNSGTGEQRQVNVVDNLSVTQPGHQMKFGVDYRWLAPFTSPFFYRQFVQYTGMGTAPGGALSGVASVAATFVQTSDALLSRNFSLYAQDTWKITPRL